MSEESRELTELEAKFKQAYTEGYSKIREQKKIASEAIRKAEEIAEEYGIPFRSSVTPLSMAYRPESFSEKWGELDSDVIEELTDGTMYSIPGEDGWEHSAVCY